MVSEELPSGLERLELSTELGHADHSGDKLDLVGLEQVLVLSLRVLDQQADGRRPRVDQRVGQVAKTREDVGRSALSSHVWSSDVLSRHPGAVTS